MFRDMKRGKYPFCSLLLVLGSFSINGISVNPLRSYILKSCSVNTNIPSWCNDLDAENFSQMWKHSRPKRNSEDAKELFQPERTILETDSAQKFLKMLNSTRNGSASLISIPRKLSSSGPVSQSTTSVSSAPPTPLPWKHHPNPAISRTSRMLSHILVKTLEVHKDEKSLERLTTLIVMDLKKCDLIIAFDRSFQGSVMLETLVRNNHFKQVVFMESREDIQDQVVWKSSRCQAILLLLSESEPLIDFGNQGMSYWDYTARVIVTGLTKYTLEVLIQTRKFKKTEHIVGIVKSDRKDYYNIYTNKLYGEKGLTHITTWLGQSFSGTSNLFPDKISNLQQTVLNVITFEWPPAIMYRRDSNKTILLRYGRDIAVVKVLAEVFNFTIVFKEPHPEELWGFKLPNGTWNGMVGLLGRGEGDLAVANLYLTDLQGRTTLQEFSIPYADDESCWLARVDPPLPRWQSPGLPYQMLSWMAIFAGLLLAGPVLYILARVSARNAPEESSFQSLVNASLYAYGAHFWHPMAVLPKRASTKIFVAFLWLYAIILVTGYKSNLTAFLTVTRQPASVETIKELYESDFKIFGFPFYQVSMEQAGNPYLRALALGDRFDNRSNFDEIKKEILAGQGVMCNSKRYLEFISAQVTTPLGIPRVRIIKECFAPYTVGVSYQRHSPLTRKFDRFITWMFEGGLVRKWFVESISLYQKFKAEDAKEQQEFLDDGDEVFRGTDGVIPLGTDHMQGIFIIWVFGIIISMFSFAGEVYIG